jgi:aminopeptidase N
VKSLQTDGRSDRVSSQSLETLFVGGVDVDGVINKKASTRKTLGGYFIQTYFKGALVLHMMRVILRDQSGSDDLFITILRDFLKIRQGKLASTEDFRAIVYKHASGDWSGFFDQWIYGADIPTLRWRYETSRKPDREGNYSLSVRVRREDEGSDFIPPVPIRVELKGGEYQEPLLSVEDEEDVFHRLFSAPIEDVELNPDRTFLVHAKETR